MEVDEAGDERMCRFCFGDDEDGELISPCKCKGGQKYIHLECLRRWQRMVLVSQPTHPAFWSDDIRHRMCNVCKSNFTCAPPRRDELMVSFTGPEIAALLQEGCMIASAETFTEMMKKQVEENPLGALLGGYHNWIDSAYLITDVEENDGTLVLPLETMEELETVRKKLLDGDLTIKVSDKVYRLVREEVFSEADDLKDALQKLSHVPCNFKLVSESTCSDDSISAVNMSAYVQSSHLDQAQTNEIKRLVCLVAKRYPQISDLEILNFKGGPCDTEKIVTCVVLGGGIGRRPYKVFHDPLKAFTFAAARGEKHGNFVAGQTVKITNLQNKTELNGKLGLLQRFNESNGRWEVLTFNSCEVKLIKPENLEHSEEKTHAGPRILCFWGDARWTRAQLLGEIARGHWGLCKVLVEDVITTESSKLRRSLDGRLVFSPVTEMTEKWIREMETHRREARQIADDT